MASRAFAAVARAVLFVMVDPDNESTRLLGQPKNNLGRSDLPTLTFHIVPHVAAHTLEGDIWTGKLEWLGESERSIREAMSAAAESVHDKSATSEAADWLQDYLSSGDPVDVAIIKKESAKTGHSRNALYRAKQQLGVVSVTSGFPKRAFWALHASSSKSLGETTNGTNGTNGTTEAPLVPVVPLIPVISSLPNVGTTESFPKDYVVAQCPRCKRRSEAMPEWMKRRWGDAAGCSCLGVFFEWKPARSGDDRYEPDESDHAERARWATEEHPDYVWRDVEEGAAN